MSSLPFALVLAACGARAAPSSPPTASLVASRGTPLGSIWTDSSPTR